MTFSNPWYWLWGITIFMEDTFYLHFPFYQQGQYFTDAGTAVFCMGDGELLKTVEPINQTV